MPLPPCVPLNLDAVRPSSGCRSGNVYAHVRADGASQAIATASAAGDTTAIANAFSLSFAFGYAVPAAYAAAAAIQLGSPNTCNNYAAAAYISALTNAIAISNTEAAAQAIYAAFTLGW